MPRAVRVLVILTVMAAPLVVPGSAAAKGASWFEFEEDYVVPGDVVEGRARFWIYNDLPTPAAGPFHAYLFPEGGWIRPPNIPAGAVDLGTVEFGPIQGEDRPETAWARVSFTVPSVAPGLYRVGLCNVPCTDAGVGDLLGGSVSIVGSRELIPVTRARDRALFRAQHAERRVKIESRKVERLKQHLAEVRPLEEANRALLLRVDALESRIRELSRAEAQEPRTGVPWVGWMVLAGLLVFGAILAVRARRDHHRLPPEDLPPPDELVDVPPAPGRRPATISG